jgi:hypothetical protein
MRKKSKSTEIPQKQGNVGYKKPPKETQFKPGQSGNPSGLPKGTPKVSVALMKLLAGNPGEQFTPRSRAEEIALALLNKAASGDVQAIREVSDRTEGKSPATLNVNKSDARAERYQRLADEMAAKYNKPRDEVVRDIIESEPEAAQWLM